MRTLVVTVDDESLVGCKTMLPVLPVEAIVWEARNEGRSIEAYRSESWKIIGQVHIHRIDSDQPAVDLRDYPA